MRGYVMSDDRYDEMSLHQPILGRKGHRFLLEVCMSGSRVAWVWLFIKDVYPSEMKLPVLFVLYNYLS
jgi:hypothetical protein